MPSVREGMGIALMEALCLGIPSFISNASGFDWAKELPGVLVIEEEASWEIELSKLSNLKYSLLKAAAEQNSKTLWTRFSASRGVDQYLSLYDA